TTRSDFYVYALFRENGVPFYIGKGRHYRWGFHEWDAKRGTSGHKHSIIRNMQLRGVEIIKIRLHEGLTEVIAHDYEVALIKAIGRGDAGPLVNFTDGGEGLSGTKRTAEIRSKISISQRNSKLVAAAHAARIGKKLTPETRAKISIAHRGRIHSAESRANMSKAHKGQGQTPEVLEKMAAARRGKPMSAEHKAKISAANKSPSLEKRNRMSIARRIYYQNLRAINSVVSVPPPKRPHEGFDPQ